MDMRKKLLGEEHPDTLLSMGNLANTSLYQGRCRGAAGSSDGHEEEAAWC